MRKVSDVSAAMVSFVENTDLTEQEQIDSLIYALAAKIFHADENREDVWKFLNICLYEITDANQSEKI